MNLLSVFVDALLPNRAAWRKAGGPGYPRLAFWVIRLSLAVLLLALMLLFGIHQHQELH